MLNIDKLTIKEVKEYIENNKLNYEVRGMFIKNKRTCFKIVCKKCGKVRKIISSNIFKLNICPNCKKIKSKKDCLKKFIDTLDSEYELLDGVKKYKNNKSKMKFKHKKCNKIFYMSINNFKNGCRCPYCNKYRKKTHEEYKQRVELEVPEYELLDTFQNTYTKVKFRHKKCNKTFYKLPLDIFKYGCPYCKMSKGEKYIQKLLDENNIIYKREYRIKECKDKKTLPFDFAIFNSKNELLALIEFDGKQHFEKGWFGEDQFEMTKRHDKIKNKYCKENNIKLLRIKYNENIENKLINFIKMLGR